jgi:hypothetical protein
MWITLIRARTPSALDLRFDLAKAVTMDLAGSLD